MTDHTHSVLRYTCHCPKHLTPLCQWWVGWLNSDCKNSKYRHIHLQLTVQLVSRHATIWYCGVWIHCNPASWDCLVMVYVAIKVSVEFGQCKQVHLLWDTFTLAQMCLDTWHAWRHFASVSVKHLIRTHPTNYGENNYFPTKARPVWKNCLKVELLSRNSSAMLRLNSEHVLEI